MGLDDLLLRVGIWISQCDNTDDGMASEKLEYKAFQKALKNIAEKSTVPEVAHAAAQALARSEVSHFTTTREEAKEALKADIEAAVAQLKADEKMEVLSNFRKALLYVGHCVARAYREELDHHEEEFMLETLLNKVAGDVNKESDPEEFKDINISSAEDSALTFIKGALQ